MAYFHPFSHINTMLSLFFSRRANIEGKHFLGAHPISQIFSVKRAISYPCCDPQSFEGVLQHLQVVFLNVFSCFFFFPSNHFWILSVSPESGFCTLGLTAKVSWCQNMGMNHRCDPALLLQMFPLLKFNSIKQIVRKVLMCRTWQSKVVNSPTVEPNWAYWNLISKRPVHPGDPWGGSVRECWMELIIGFGLVSGSLGEGSRIRVSSKLRVVKKWGNSLTGAS